MTAPRFFLERPLFVEGVGTDPTDPGSGVRVPDPVVEVPLTPEDLHHLADVLRLRSGEALTVAEPSGRVWLLVVEDVTRARLTARVVQEEAVLPGPRITLVQGVAKGPKMDRIVEQAVELGAERITPVICARTVVRLDEGKRLERGARWRRVAEAAAKQSRRSAIPRVDDPVGLEHALGGIALHDVILVVWEDAADEPGIPQVLEEAGAEPSSTVAVVIGPEGGLAADEVARLGAAGGRICTLGASVLRTETASAAALVLAGSALGGFRSG